MYTFNSKLQVYEGKPGGDTTQFASAKHISNARMAAPTYLNSAITYMAGQGGDYQAMNFPLLMALQGSGRKKEIESIDGEYRIRMYGKPKTVTFISKAITQANCGANHANFKLVMADDLFQKNETISTGGLNGIKVKILSDGVKIGANQYEYLAQRAGTPTSAAIPSKYLLKGVKWTGGLITVSKEGSHGTKQKTWQTPFELFNILTTFRKSYKVRGNVANKKMVMPIELPNGKTTSFWMDWDYFNDELDFAVQRNNDLWFSELNMDEHGVVHNIDANTGEIAPTGMGLWHMIKNEIEFPIMTKDILDQAINEIFFQVGTPINLKGDYVITGGLGFIRDFNKVMEKESKQFLTLLTDNHFITKGEKGLRYGNYFTEYLHESGKVIKVVYDQAFDYGTIALTGEKHPRTGLPLSSHCGVALDFSETEVKGKIENNITMVYEKGRELVENYVLGMNEMPGAPVSKVVSTDKDESSYHKIGTHGLYLHRPLTCAKFICKVA
jgi:hypothetical protein